ncbi:MAG: fasciclin domain-containing protein [Williamsia sp.]|nr:fasciclin domain-containing protein [Williamsia sp.]
MKTTFLWISLLALCGVSCKKWDDHNKVDNADLTKTLLTEISQRSNLSKFYEYLKKTGLDKELSSSKTYTVWAPVNDALQTLDPAIVADTVKLKQFIANHISYESYFTANAQTAFRVPMLNGKRVVFAGKKFDDASITEADKYVGNGVLQVIDKAAPVYPNGWELVNNTRTNFLQSAFILSQTRKVFDATNAIIDSINAQTGQPVYRPGTDSVLRNSFNAEVYDLQNEEKQYTFFILNDAAFNTETGKLNAYFKTSTADSTKNLAQFAVLKDLAVEGEYTMAQLPAVLVSKFGVKIPIDKSKIVETRRLSNGIAYVISGISFDVKEKIPPVVVQGENYRGFFDANNAVVTPRQNNVSAVFVRSRINPVSGLPYTDVFVYNHGISALGIQYRVLNLPAVKYKVYWVAVNDTLIVDRTNAIVPAVFNQRLAMGAVGANFLPNATGQVVNPLSYTETYIGDWVQSAYGTLNMYLTAAASTAAATNKLNLDYIRLVPDL